MNQPIELPVELAETHELVRDFYEGTQQLHHEFIRRKSDQKADGHYRAFYPNGQLWCEEIYKDGHLWETIQDLLPDGSTLENSFIKNGSGHSKVVSREGKLLEEGDRREGLREGIWLYYHLNGQLKARGPYQRDQAEGEWEHFNENGTPNAKGRFVAGLREGETIYFHENGAERSRGQMRAGKKVGQWVYYDKDKNYLGEENFMDGKRHGLDRTMYPNGKVKAEGSYENDLKVGVWKSFYESGALSREYNLAADKLHGSDKTYYEDGKIKAELFYEGGLRCGTWRRYAAAGFLENESTYSTEPLGGYSRVFDASGKLIKEGPIAYDKSIDKWGWAGLWRIYEADGRVLFELYKYEKNEVLTVKAYYDPAPLLKILQEEPAEKHLSLMLQAMKGSHEQLYKSLEVLLASGAQVSVDVLVSMALASPQDRLPQIQALLLPQKEAALSLLMKQPKDQTEWPACGALLLSLHAVAPEMALSEEYDLCLAQSLYWAERKTCILEELREVLRKIPIERREELVFQKQPSQPLQDNRLLLEFAGVCQTPRVLQALIAITLSRQSYQLDRVSGKSLLSALTSFGDAAAASIEPALKGSKKQATRRFLLEALAKSGSLAAAETLLRYTKSKNATIAALARDGLIAMGDALLPMVESWMLGRAISKRESAAKLLKAMPKTAAVEQLIVSAKSRARPDVKTILSAV